MKLTANQVLSPVSPQQADKGGWTQLLRIMKLTTIIILAACLHVSAKGVAQQTITFSGKEVTLENVFNAIKKQSNYRFFFNTDMLKNASKVTIDVKNAQIEQVMNLALKDQPLTFAIKGRTIFIMKKPEEEKKSAQVASPTGDPITVSGRVTDDQGQPLVGANVKVKGSQNGITTDAQGRFTLTNVDPNATLEISFVGHETQLLSVKGKTVFSVALGQKLSVLDETVVIAYGTTTKRFSTGNVSTVKASDIEKQPVNNPLLALQGRVPGLVVAQQTGVAGGGIIVRIQGQNSITKGNDPLYVIDGVPISPQVPTTGLSDAILGNSGSYTSGFFNVTGAGNPLSYINPNDIESIDILKDADATAIYGSRAANGAILITTKKGKTGAAKGSFNLYQGWGNVTRKIEMLNTRQYLDMRYEALKNGGININTISATSAGYYDLKVWDTARNTDWQKELIGGTSQYTNVNGSVSGGNDYLQYLVSGTYYRETTVFPGDFSDTKASIHINLNTFSANKKFHVKFSGFYLIDNNLLPRADLTNKAILLEPNAPHLFNTDGTLNWGPTVAGRSSFDINPMADLLKTYRNKTNNLVSNTIVGYQILPGFEVSSSFGFTKMQGNEFVALPLSAVRPEARPNSKRASQFGFKDIQSWIIEPQANYNRQLGPGKLNILAGGTFQQYNDNGFYVEGQGYGNDDVLQNISAAAQIVPGYQFNSEYKYNAVFGRMNYNLGDKYIVNLNGRRDGSSRFGSKNQFHNFGSVGAAWVFSSEKLVKEKLSFISFGKVRISYGTSGNDQIGDYAFMNLYGNTFSSLPYQGATGLQPTNFSDPYMAWENTKKFSFGIDLGVLKDRILMNVTYARNRSSNQILNYSLPNFTGFGAVTTNFPATVQNTSWEFNLNAVNFNKKSFTWTINLNLTIPKNKLIEFPGIESSSYATTYFVGEPVSVQRVWHFLGVDPATGLYQAADLHGNPTSSPDYQMGRNTLVNTLPKLYGGFQNSISYKGFQLDFLFQFTEQKGQNFYYYNGNRYPGQFSRGTSNQPTTVLNRWQRPGDISNIQKYSTSLQGHVAVLSDAAYTDASYIRLKNTSLSYQFSKGWLQKFHLRDCNLYMRGQNLWTLTNYKGMDPENQSFAALPPLRIWTVGLKFGL